MDDVPFARLLTMAVAVAIERLHTELAAAGHPDLRPAHGYALNAILDGHDTASAIAPRLGMTKQGAAKVLATLAELGYVEQAGGSGDARRRPFTLTARGRDAVALSVRIQAEIERAWAGEVGERRLRTARLVLQEAVLAESGGQLPPLRPAW